MQRRGVFKFKLQILLDFPGFILVNIFNECLLVLLLSQISQAQRHNFRFFNRVLQSHIVHELHVNYGELCLFVVCKEWYSMKVIS